MSRRLSLPHCIALCITLLVVNVSSLAAVVDFGEFSLPPYELGPESYWNGADGSGGFTSAGAAFNNYFVDWGSGFTTWGGWSVSNTTDTTTPGFENQYSAATGEGADGSAFYGVAYEDSFNGVTPTIDLPAGALLQSMKVTNTTYAWLSMRDGDGYAKQFGGTTGEDPDWFKLIVTGWNEDESELGQLDFYLADYRFADSALDYILTDWTVVDLSSLSTASRLTFSFDSSDGGPWGINTPAYVAMDALTFIPEPTAAGLMLMLAALVVRRRTGRAFPFDRSRRCASARRRATAVVAGLTVTASALASSPFSTAVVDYSPAPGQFVNDSYFNNPAASLGRPYAGGFMDPENSSLTSLGGFGGTLTLGFDHTVFDDPANPFGLDAIVFGNALFVSGHPNRRWAECGVIEISRDLNTNGLADDPWYLIPGSHITDLAGQYDSQTWDDDVADSTYPPSDALWLPMDFSGQWTTATWHLPSALFEVQILENPLGLDATEEAVFGYVDYAPTLKLGDIDGDNQVEDPDAVPEEFYVRPDNPFVVGLTLGSCGGDAFDIAWAVDPVTGEPANLDGFDFVRLTTAVNAVIMPFGELSTEIDAVADVAEGQLGDAENDGDIDLDDVAVWSACFGGPDVAIATSPCRVMDFDQDGDLDLSDLADMQAGFTGGL